MSPNWLGKRITNNARNVSRAHQPLGRGRCPAHGRNSDIRRSNRRYCRPSYWAREVGGHVRFPAIRTQARPSAFGQKADVIRLEHWCGGGKAGTRRATEGERFPLGRTGPARAHFQHRITLAPFLAPRGRTEGQCRRQPIPIPGQPPEDRAADLGWAQIAAGAMVLVCSR